MKSLKMSKGSLPVRQSGFTLVEIAIVLVIIGLLLGGVLKGQELIENAKVKNSVKDIQGITAAYYGYIDRFKRLPGDDGPDAPTLQARGGAWINITAFGNANGILSNNVAASVFAPPAVATVASEGTPFWQHLKAAGLISGNPADTSTAALPVNAFNGLIGVAASYAAASTGVNGNSICLSQVPGKAARAIDLQLDDGITDTGSIRATLGAVGANTAPGVAVAAATGYVDTNQYTICSTL